MFSEQAFAGEYCAYRHVASMLERTGIDWWLAMIRLEHEVYFDDSGTDAGSPIAVAACYVATKGQWDEFVRNFDELRAEHGFDEFKMSEFVAKADQKHEPFCHWDKPTKDLVYRRVAGAINLRVRQGFAVPKKAFDKYVTPEFREHHAANHYVWAIHTIFALLAEWRTKYGVETPMQYVFDSGSSEIKKQILKFWEDNRPYPHRERRYGMVPDGAMFQDSKIFKPLQTADILGWQVQNHMRRTYAVGKEPTSSTPHSGFHQLIYGRPMELGYYTEERMETLIREVNEIKQETGKWPWEVTAAMAGKVWHE